MELLIDGRRFALRRDVQTDEALRGAYNALARQVFGGLDFTKWYDAGCWTGRYQPHALVHKGTLAASAAVNLMRTRWQGRDRLYIQIGTVMTAPAYQGMGLARYLMERILADWRDACDGIYLYANDSVLDFYPKFGFVAAQEYETHLPLTPGVPTATPLDVTTTEGRALLRRCYERGNPFALLPMLDNFELLMFHCLYTLPGCVYHVAEFDAIVVAAREGEALLVSDIYCGENTALADVLGAVAHEGRSTARLGFALKDVPQSSLHPREEEDTTLFVLDGKENVFAQHKTMLPVLSYA